METNVPDAHGTPRPDTEVARIKHNVDLDKEAIYRNGFEMKPAIVRLAEEARKSPDGKVVVDAKTITQVEHFFIVFDAWVSWCSRGCPGDKPSGFDY